MKILWSQLLITFTVLKIDFENAIILSSIREFSFKNLNEFLLIAFRNLKFHFENIFDHIHLNEAQPVIHLIIGHFPLAFFCFNDFTRDSLSPIDHVIFIFEILRWLSLRKRCRGLEITVWRLILVDTHKSATLGQGFGHIRV